MGAAATTLTRAVGDFVDATVTHDHTDTVILEAPVTAAALPALVAIAASGGVLAAVGTDYIPAEGFPKLMMIVQTYANNDFFTGEHAERNVRLVRGRKEKGRYAATDSLEDKDVDPETRSKGIMGRLLDLSADILTSPILMGASESAQLRLYLGPDDGCVLLESVIDDLLYKVISDLLFFNDYCPHHADSNFKVDMTRESIDVGVEFGGLFGIFEKTGPVLRATVDRTVKPLDVPLVPAPLLTPRLTALAEPVPGDADGSRGLVRRLANPRWRFAGVAPGAPPTAATTITGFALVETIATAPVVPLADWAWSPKLLEAGSVNWHTSDASPLQDLVNRFRNSTDQTKVRAYYGPHSKLAYNQIASPGEVAKHPTYARWLRPESVNAAILAKVHHDDGGANGTAAS